MKLLNEDIKTGQFKKVYLLYGEEDYLRRQYRDRLREGLAGEDTMNCHCFEGKDIDVQEVIDLAETLPFLAERRVLIIENSGWFKKGGEAMSEYLTRLADTAWFVFVESEVDKRNKLFKTVNSVGRAVEFPLQDENTLKRWIQGLLKSEKKQISTDTAGYLLEMTGTDMENIRKELEKVICYAIDREAITKEDIDAVCTKRISNQIFEMINAMADKRQKQALQLYYDLLALKEPPMRILFLIARQFNLLLQVKELRSKGYDNRAIGDKVKLHSFIAGKYVAQASRFTGEGLKAALEDCVETEESVKKGKLDDGMSVELLIIRYSSNPSETKQ